MLQRAGSSILSVLPPFVVHIYPCLFLQSSPKNKPHAPIYLFPPSAIGELSKRETKVHHDQFCNWRYGEELNWWWVGFAFSNMKRKRVINCEKKEQQMVWGPGFVGELNGDIECHLFGACLYYCC